MPNYQESIIYKLCCKDTSITDIYIGSTTNFRRRKCEHKRTCNNVNSKEYLLYKNVFIRDNGGWDNWDMIQIKEVSCNSKRELEAEERKVFDELKPTLNSVAPPCEKGRIQSIKNYYINNRELMLEKQKIYVKNNREIVKERLHKWYEKVKTKRNEKILCECGAMVSNINKKRHDKTKKHLSYIEPN